MLQTLDILFSFVVIMAVVSLLITILVQMISAAFSLRGKNLANALSLTFQTIDPKIGEQAHELAAHILNNPILSDSLFRTKDRTPPSALLSTAALAAVTAHDALAQAKDALSKAEATDAQAKADAAAALGDAPKKAAVAQAPANITTAQQAVDIAQADLNKKQPAAFKSFPSPKTKPWKFRNLFGAWKLATAVRPAEVYRVLGEISKLSAADAAQRGLSTELPDKAANLLKAFGLSDGTADEAKAKLTAVSEVADVFTTPAQKKAVVDSVANLSALVETASSQAYDRFERWFNSAQDRAAQWFQMHTRIIAIVCSFVLAFALQLDTVEIFRQLHDGPGLVQSLVNSAPGFIAQADPLLDPATSAGSANTLPHTAYLRWQKKHPLYSLEKLPEHGALKDYLDAIESRLANGPDSAWALTEYDRLLKDQTNPDTAALDAFHAFVAKFKFDPPLADPQPPEGKPMTGPQVRQDLTTALAEAGKKQETSKDSDAWLADYKVELVGSHEGAVDQLRTDLEKTGFDLVPKTVFGRWETKPPEPADAAWYSHWGDWISFAWNQIFCAHFFGMLVTAGLLTFGAPFWFNLLKNLVNLRPAVANLIPRQPQNPASPPPPAPTN